MISPGHHRLELPRGFYKAQIRRGRWLILGAGDKSVAPGEVAVPWTLALLLPFLFPKSQGGFRGCSLYSPTGPCALQGLHLCCHQWNLVTTLEQGPAISLCTWPMNCVATFV